MAVFNKKADFMMIFSVANANVNGDPNADARPRVDDNNYGLMSDVCFKHKVRNYLEIVYGSEGNDRVLLSPAESSKGFGTIKARVEAGLTAEELTKLSSNKINEYAERMAIVCSRFIDVRMFGAMLAYKQEGTKSKKKDADSTEKEKAGVSLGIRGPITVQWAKTVAPVVVFDNGITKCISTDTEDEKGSDTMGNKSFVKHGLYVVKGSINGFNAEKCGLTEEDVEKFKQALLHMFECDESASRPSGSIKVEKVFWWQHNSRLGNACSADVFDTVHIECNSNDPESFGDYTITVNNFDGCPEPIVLK